MQLMTPELEKAFKKQGKQSNSKDPVIIAKFFNPVGAGTWYATEMWYTIRYVNPSTQMPSMSENSVQERSGAMQDVFESPDSKDAKKKGLQGNQKPSVQGVVDGQRLHDDLSANASGSSEKLRTESNSSAGKEDRTVSEAGRGSTPQKRDSIRRPSGQPSADDKNRAPEVPLHENSGSVLEIEASELKNYPNAEILNTKFFGYVTLFENEWGTFSLDELQDLKLPYGHEVEMDILWKPKTFSEARLGG